MTTDTIPIKDQIAAGIAEGLAFEHKRAFVDAKDWLVAELTRWRDSTNPPEAIKQALDVILADAALKSPEDRALQRYAIYLDAFEAKLTGDTSRARLQVVTVDERMASALGTLDASTHGQDGPVLTGRFEHQRELHKLLHEDDAPKVRS